MTLDQYLNDENLSSASFGEKVQLSGPSVHRIRNGEQNLSTDLALKIEAATAGRVTVAELASARASVLARTA